MRSVRVRFLRMNPDLNARKLSPNAMKQNWNGQNLQSGVKEPGWNGRNLKPNALKPNRNGPNRFRKFARMRPCCPQMSARRSLKAQRCRADSKPCRSPNCARMSRCCRCVPRTVSWRRGRCLHILYSYRFYYLMRCFLPDFYRIEAYCRKRVFLSEAFVILHIA